VLEATMLLGLPQFIREDLLASLLMFRFLYFMLPLSVAALLLGGRELSLLAKSAITVRACRKRLFVAGSLRH